MSTNDELRALVTRLRDSAQLRGILPEWATKEMEAAAARLDSLAGDVEHLSARRNEVAALLLAETAKRESAERERDALAGLHRDACQEIDVLRAELARVRADAERLDYIERTFSGMTNRERYLPVQMVWGKGCNGRTLREACDKYMSRDFLAAKPKGEL